MKKTVVYALVIAFAIYAIFPIYWMASGSLKPLSELYARPQRFFPLAIVWAHYKTVFWFTNFFRCLWNSIWVALITSFLNVTIGCMAAYSFTHFKFKGQKVYSRFILLVYMFPPIILVFPLYLTLHALHLLDSLSGLILSYLSKTLPFTIWLFIGFVRTIPVQIEDAAKIDGCGNFGVFTRILLPLLAPALPAGAMFAFIMSWNEFLYAMVMIADNFKKTLPVGFYDLLGSDQQEWGAMLAWLTLIVLPPLIFYLFIYRRMVRGLTAGAVKG